MILLHLAVFSAGAYASIPSSDSCNSRICSNDLVLLQTEAQRIQAPSSMPAPDIAKMIAQMNVSIATVDDLIAQANATVSEAMMSIFDMTTGLNDALSRVKSTAEAMRIVLGPETVDKVVGLVNQLLNVLTPVIEKFDEYSAKINKTLQDLIVKYDAQKDEVYAKFMTAVEKVNALVPASGATSLLQQGKAKALPDWFKKIFGMGGSSPCDQAKAAIKAANGTVTEAYNMMVSLNATMCQDILDQTVVTATESLAKAKQSFDDAMANYGSQLPTAIQESISKAAATVFTAADQLQATVDKKKAKVEDMIKEAQKQATSLYEASQKLADQATSDCA